MIVSRKILKMMIDTFNHAIECNDESISSLMNNGNRFKDFIDDFQKQAFKQSLIIESLSIHEMIPDRLSYKGHILEVKSFNLDNKFNIIGISFSLNSKIYRLRLNDFLLKFNIK